MFKKTVLVAALVSACIGVSACQSNSKAAPEVTRKAVTILESEKLNQLLEQYFTESMNLNPVFATFVGVSGYNHKFGDPISEQSTAKQIAFEKKYLEAINQVDITKLGTDQIPSILSNKAQFSAS